MVESQTTADPATAERAPDLIEGICELTLEARDLDRVAAFDVEDPEGNVAEVWDFFNRDDGAREGVDALA